MLSLRAADVRPLPRGRFTEVTIPLYSEGHVLPPRLAHPADGLGARRRPAGVGVRRDPAAPPGQVTIAAGRSLPSRLILPVVPGVIVPTGLPPCPGLRGEPCRAYAPPANHAVPLSGT